MFMGCLNLEYINLNNFLKTSNARIDNIFENVPENVVVCLDGNDDKLKQEIYKKIVIPKIVLIIGNKNKKNKLLIEMYALILLIMVYYFNMNMMENIMKVVQMEIQLIIHQLDIVNALIAMKNVFIVLVNQ